MDSALAKSLDAKKVETVAARQFDRARNELMKGRAADQDKFKAFLARGLETSMAARAMRRQATQLYQHAVDLFGETPARAKK
jgi:hypothetical protein